MLAQRGFYMLFKRRVLLCVCVTHVYFSHTNGIADYMLNIILHVINYCAAAEICVCLRLIDDCELWTYKLCVVYNSLCFISAL